MARTITKRQRKYADEIALETLFRDWMTPRKPIVLKPELPEDFSKATPKPPEQKQSKAPTKEARRRQSLLDDPNTLYICDTRTGYVHDKECDLIPQIPNSCFTAASWLPYDKSKICSRCFKNAIIRSSIGSERKHLEAYKNFFNSIGFTEDYLYHLFVDNRTTLISIDKNSVKLKVNEDSWIIEKCESYIQLWHNNYIVCKDFSRVISDSYHKQARINFRSGAGAKTLMDLMCNYSWGEHKHKLKVEKTRQEDQRRYDRLWSRQINYCIKKKGLFHTKIFYIDISNQSKELFKEEGLKVRIIRRWRCTLHQRYPLRYCKVKTKELPKFEAVMEKLKTNSMCTRLRDYVCACFLTERKDKNG